MTIRSGENYRPVEDGMSEESRASRTMDITEVVKLLFDDKQQQEVEFRDGQHHRSVVAEQPGREMQMQWHEERAQESQASDYGSRQYCGLSHDI